MGDSGFVIQLRVREIASRALEVRIGVQDSQSWS